MFQVLVAYVVRRLAPDIVVLAISLAQDGSAPELIQSLSIILSVGVPVLLSDTAILVKYCSFSVKLCAASWHKVALPKQIPSVVGPAPSALTAATVDVAMATSVFAGMSAPAMALIVKLPELVST